MAIDIDRLTAALAERYTLEHEIGAGGMAVVYQAEDIRHGRKVAIKVLRPELAATLGAERFLQEVRTTAGLHHANILTLIDSGEADGFIYYVLPLVDGESLRERLSRESQLPVEDAVAIAAEVADALEYAHNAGVVHRDVKPDNIMLSAGHAALMDFGVATAASAAGEQRLTQTGVSVGSPTYMSPEQADPNTRVDGRSDVYSLGCTLYEMLAGHPPFTGSTTQSILARKSVEDPPSIRVVRPAVPEALERSVFNSLERSPADRYRSAAEFRQVLQATARQRIDDRTPPFAPHRRSRPNGRRRIASIAVVVALLAAAGWWSLNRPDLAGVEVRSIAVLPFENLTGDTMDQRMIEAVHANLTRKLGEISALDIKSRRSVLALRDSGLSTEAIARELGVDGILEGSVFGTDSILEFGFSLFAVVPEEKRLWDKTYAEEVRNILNLESAVALAVAREVHAAITADEQERLNRRRAVVPEAFEAYSFGLHHMQRFNPEDLNTAVEYFERAIGLESDNALYHAALSRTLIEAGSPHGDMAPGEAFPRAKQAALRAVDLDESLGEGHAALGQVLNYYDQDLGGAEQAFRRAIALNPNSATAHAALGGLLSRQFRTEEALAEHKIAQRLEPLVPIHSGNVAVESYYLGHYDEAIENATRSVELDPNFAPSLWILGEAYSAQGMHDEAIAAHERAVGFNEAFSAFLVHTYAAAGRPADAEKLFSDLKLSLRESSDRQRAYSLGLGYAVLGQRDSALTWLETAAANGDPYLQSIKYMPHFDSLREEPRFQALLAALEAVGEATSD